MHPEAKVRSWLRPLYKNVRHMSMGKRLRLTDLPEELLLCIADHLETDRDINAFSKVNRRLHNLLDTYLYRHNVRVSNSSALVWAAQTGIISTARKLLEQSADVEVATGRIDRYPRTYTRVKPLWLATWWGHVDMVKLLLEIPNIDVDPREPQQGKTPLHMAVLKGHKEIVSLFIDVPGIDLDRRTNKGKTPLLLAAKHGHVEIVKMLLAKGVDVNARASGPTPLLVAIRRQHEEVVEVLLQDENINPNLQGLGERWPNTPLMGALHNPTIVKLLLDKKVDVNLRPRSTGHTALIEAVARDYTDVVTMLLDHGADVNISDPNNENALIKACTSSRQGLKMVEQLLEAGADIEARGGLYGNALIAASCHNESVAKLLISRGADVHAKGDFYASALYAASYAGYTDLVKILLGKGVEINIKSREGTIALHVAAYGGHAVIVKMLLENGADVQARSDRFGNALEAARTAQRYRRGDFTQTIRLLLEAGVEDISEGFCT